MRDLVADSQSTRGCRSAERLGVSVACDEVDAGRLGSDHLVDRVTATPANSDDTDGSRLWLVRRESDAYRSRDKQDQDDDSGDDERSVLG